MSVRRQLKAKPATFKFQRTGKVWGRNRGLTYTPNGDRECERRVRQRIAIKYRGTANGR